MMKASASVSISTAFFLQISSFFLSFVNFDCCSLTATFLLINKLVLNDIYIGNQNRPQMIYMISSFDDNKFT